MALAEGTSSVTPKPPKPQVSYGAPSGPYASPIFVPSTPAAGGVPGGIPDMPSAQLPQAMEPLMTRYGLIQRKPQRAIDEFYEEQGNLVRGGRPADPTTLGHLDSAKFAAGLATMFPLGPGPEIGAASKAPRALSLLGDAWRGIRGEKNASRAVSYPTGDAPASKYALQSLGQHAGFGPEVQAHRAATEAPSIEEHLATLRALTSRHVGNMVNKQQGKVTGYKVPGIGTAQRGKDPMEGKYFDYTGQATPKDPKELQAMVDDMMGIEMPGTDRQLMEHVDRHPMGAMTDAEGGDSIHNIQDKFKNTIGSLTYSEEGGRIAAHEGYIRPEHRNLKNLYALAKPLMESNLPIDVTAANPQLGRLLRMAQKRGMIHPESNIYGEDLWSGTRQKGPMGYEVPQELLPALFKGNPRLVGSEGRSTTFRPSGSRTPSWGESWPMGFNPAR